MHENSYRFRHWQTPRGQGRTAWASWLKAHRSPGHYRPYFSPINKKKKKKKEKWNKSTRVRRNPFRFPTPPPLLCSLWERCDRSPAARGGGTAGDTTATSSGLTDLPPGLRCRYRPPLRCRRLLPHRSEQEVGRWSREKRRACGPLTTSCSLFGVTKKKRKKMSQEAVRRPGPGSVQRVRCLRCGWLGYRLPQARRSERRAVLI